MSSHYRTVSFISWFKIANAFVWFFFLITFFYFGSDCFKKLIRNLSLFTWGKTGFFPTESLQFMIDYYFSWHLLLFFSPFQPLIKFFLFNQIYITVIVFSILFMSNCGRWVLYQWGFAILTVCLIFNFNIWIICIFRNRIFTCLNHFRHLFTYLQFKY